MSNLAVMSRYFSNTTNNGRNNLELLSTFRDRVVMIILNLLQTLILEWIIEAYKRLSQ